MFHFTHRAAKRADSLLDNVWAKLTDAFETASIAAEHAVEAIAHHDAQVAYHQAQHAAAVGLHDEAQAALKDVGALLGHDLPTVVEAATTAEAAVDAVEGEAK